MRSNSKYIHLIFPPIQWTRYSTVVRTKLIYWSWADWVGWWWCSCVDEDSSALLSYNIQDSYSSRAEARRSRSAAHSAQIDDHWPSTDFFHSVSICVSVSEGCGVTLTMGAAIAWFWQGFDEGLELRNFQLKSKDCTLRSSMFGQ
jgi:hypothetical protein